MFWASAALLEAASKKAVKTKTKRFIACPWWCRVRPNNPEV
jgi:hypothetical protein